MPKLSNKKKDKISEQIISFLFHSFPKTPFTSEIANEVIRDEEFTRELLNILEKKGLIISITKSIKGISYSRRVKWRLSNKAHEALSKQINSNPSFRENIYNS
jgi:hypothetical protein